MKKFLFTLAAVLFLACGTANASTAPDIKDLLNKAAAAAKNNKNNTPATTQGTSTDSQTPKTGLGSLLNGLAGGNSSQSGDNSNGSGILGALGGIGDVVKGIISSSDVTVADMVGTWKYSGPAVAFQSEDFLHKAGGAAASSVIKNKIEPYYSRVGLDKLEVTFNEDSTFVFTLPRATLKGNISPVADENSQGDFTFQFMALGKVPVGKMKAHVEKAASNLTITFDVSKLIDIVNSIAKFSGRKSLQSAASVLNSFEGMNAGFELQQTSTGTAVQASPGSPI